MANQISNLNKINDKLEISNQSLTKSLHDTKQSYQSEILALNARIENLNDENDQLHLRLAGEDTTNSSRVETSRKQLYLQWMKQQKVMMIPLNLIPY